MTGNECYVIENDGTGAEIMHFNKSGEFVGCVASEPKITNGMVDLPIISLLRAGNFMEFALFSDGVMRKFKPSSFYQFTEVSMFPYIQKANVVKILHRRGTFDGKSFTQMIVVYKRGTDLPSLIEQFNVEEIN